MRSGDKVGDHFFGWLTDRHGEGIMLEGEKYISNGAGSCPCHASTELGAMSSRYNPCHASNPAICVAHSTVELPRSVNCVLLMGDKVLCEVFEYLMW